MDKYTPRTWQPHERPSLPGSPSTPLHPTHKRWLYALVGVLVAITGGLGNSLVIANLQYLQGALGATTAEMAKADIDRFREELDVEYLDTLLMHCMTKGSWPTDFRPVMDVLSEAKAKDRVRAIGVSCHGIEPLRAAVKCDWVEVDLARINPVGGNKGRMDGTPQEVST